jgi:hypothetical protein
VSDFDVVFECPKCSQKLAIEASHAGTKVPCPSCQEEIAVPALRSLVHRPPNAGKREAKAVQPRAILAPEEIEFLSAMGDPRGEPGRGSGP